MSDDKRHRIHPVILQRAREMRHPLTPAEAKLWSRLRDRRLNGLKVRRQYPVDHFIADFCCPEHHLLVEVDGPSHEFSQEYDAERTAWLEGRGYRVIRFTNSDVYHNLPGVLETVLQVCAQFSHEGNRTGIL